MNIDDANEVTYQIVGIDEADVSVNKISCVSPVASALMGNYEGDEVVVMAPKGEISYEIMEVKYI
jgi:transcription elongation factor GreA